LLVVRAEADRAGTAVEVRDIDADERLRADWDHDVPVIIVDGRVHAKYRVEAVQLRAALGRRPWWRRLAGRAWPPRRGPGRDARRPPPCGGGRLGSLSGHFLLRRWWRVLRSSLRCFFLDMRLRRFLTTEPLGASVLQARACGMVQRIRCARPAETARNSCGSDATVDQPFYTAVPHPQPRASARSLAASRARASSETTGVTTCSSATARTPAVSTRRARARCHAPTAAAIAPPARPSRTPAAMPSTSRTGGSGIGIHSPSTIGIGGGGMPRKASSAFRASQPSPTT